MDMSVKIHFGSSYSFSLTFDVEWLFFRHCYFRVLLLFCAAKSQRKIICDLQISNEGC